MYFKGNKGFTLIEVIVSIAIIAMVGVLLLNFTATAVKARNISQDRLEILAACSSYMNEIKSVQDNLTDVNDLVTFLREKGFIEESGYLTKAESGTSVLIKIYINQNLKENGLFEIMIKGSSPRVDEISISTVIKGAKLNDD